MNDIQYRFANEDDVDLYYTWANDSSVRKNSYNQGEINYTNHVSWFKSKLKSKKCKFYLFYNNKNEVVGQVRIDKNKHETVIGISVDRQHRGKGYATKMLLTASNHYLSIHPSEIILAYIKIENQASYKSFINAGFTDEQIIMKNHHKSYKLEKRLSQ